MRRIYIHKVGQNMSNSNSVCLGLAQTVQTKVRRILIFSYVVQPVPYLEIPDVICVRTTVCKF